MNERVCKYTIEVTEPRRLARSVKISEQEHGLPIFDHAEPIELVVVGSRSNSAEANLRIFGNHIAGLVADAAKHAHEQGKKLVLDAATGSSPRAAWKALAGMTAAGEADMSNVIVIGHEEAWGPKPGSDTDFDFQRMEMLKSFGVGIREVNPRVLLGQQIDGNFVPMYRVGVSGTPNRGERETVSSEKEAAWLSMEKYDEIVRELLQRRDVESIGVYGIGTDGHIGEWQMSDTGIGAATEHFDAFVQPKKHYSIHEGQYPRRRGGKQNVYYQRGGSEEDQRSTWQPEYQDQHIVGGLGIREMVRLDHLVLAFNNESKRAAFELAMEGSVNGVLTNNGRLSCEITRNSGEGEGVWTDLAAYARELEGELIPKGTVDEIEASNTTLKCGMLYRAIYGALNESQATVDNPVYAKMGEFSERYIGDRSPLGQLIRFRELLGKKTTIVVTPEVVKGSKKYRSLAA